MSDQSAQDRRRRGEGSVSDAPRPDGRYQYRFRDVTGKRVSGYARTKADAYRELGKAIAKRDEGIPAPDRTMTLGKWLDHWLATMPPGKLRPRSRVRYKFVVAVWQRDHVARAKLAELTPTHVSAAMGRQAATGSSPATIATNLSILRIALKAAVLDGRVGRNVAQLVTAPVVEPRRIQPPAGDELARLRVAIADDRLEAIWSLALGAGLRHGEILGLVWRDVDLRAGIVTVRGTLEYGSDRVGPTKSRHGARRLPLAPWVTAALQRHHDREPGVIPAPATWVFHTRTGRPYHARNVLGWWHELCARAGVRRYRIHDLRHAAATALLESPGWTMPTVSRYIGHATIKQTVDTYGHPTFDGLTFPEPDLTPDLTPDRPSDARSDAHTASRNGT